jgi:adenosine/AMP kinase
MNISGISPDPVAAVLDARQAATDHEVGIAIARKQLEVVRQTGNAMNDLIKQTALAAKQIASGHLDVRV